MSLGSIDRDLIILSYENLLFIYIQSTYNYKLLYKSNYNRNIVIVSYSYTSMYTKFNYKYMSTIEILLMYHTLIQVYL